MQSRLLDVIKGCCGRSAARGDELAAVGVARPPQRLYPEKRQERHDGSAAESSTNKLLVMKVSLRLPKAKLQFLRGARDRRLAFVF
jgi:hypothetical protein